MRGSNCIILEALFHTNYAFLKKIVLVVMQRRMMLELVIITILTAKEDGVDLYKGVLQSK